ncbi:2-oxoglutarate dehydrogenase E1 component [Mesorhizobium sp. LHD-90]|uniref:2-oxoglutarate dehydrogenase E1 component n=1 Tax=Mesorhizobium sp. LHD-90 TaxID=3071414 RepID=UPI0027E11617|nr:2-oxoglutarate dehydrogenase E1 component [Mesorhizobium sp. LHD-90]MDQ6436964.1 2-oxoglutarate dehydrogenase E1 component [Mesorhizobium sp. LHD-90]
MPASFGGDSAFFLDLYARYLKDPSSVPSDWSVQFAMIDGREHPGSARQGASLAGLILDAYRRFGHREAQLDPLRRSDDVDSSIQRLRELVDAQKEETVEITIGGSRQILGLRSVQEVSRAIYSGPLGLEVEHLESEEERSWWYENFEKCRLDAADDDLCADALEAVILADEFESFMQVKFPTKKRFGIEGGETALVFIREIIRRAALAGVEDVVMGGMHRGRLATLAVALGKSPANLAAELMGRDLSEGAVFTGDVPYHLGHTSLTSIDGRTISVKLLPHPSHLMVVAPVALGMARAVGGSYNALCFLLHTDAAFSGQGLAAEVLQLGGLSGYGSGGSIHLIVNNQIGFTTLPSEGRSSRYCTDAGKLVGAPIIHVNADDPVAVTHAARLAVQWRTKFRRDVLVDLVCYRRNGHNELDEPRFTQPLAWRLIDDLPTVRTKFEAEMATERPEVAKRHASVAETFRSQLREGFEAAGEFEPNHEPFQMAAWSVLSPGEEDEILDFVETGVEISRLSEIGRTISMVPEGVQAHPKVRSFYDLRAASIEVGKNINFASAEALAIGSLLAEGKRIRLSGQDSVRGTFTQRHWQVHDMQTGATYMPLGNASLRPGSLQLVNSPLSEYGVLGFEYGHSLYDPEQLTIWEAQFGDFLNGAQVVVDQYIVSAESKWRLRSGLTLLLPHGLEGQGPDHSSSRIERLLQLCAGGNVIVANPTTPANLFHLLRRQLVAPWRKPLFVISPKSLLRAKAAVSDIREMQAGTGFRTVIPEDVADPSKVQRVVLCSGKIFYALNALRQNLQERDTILPIRIEQLYPFPEDELLKALRPYPGAEIVWLQEEAENQGPWSYLQPLLARAGIVLARSMPIISRPPMSVCAGGSVERHEREEGEILKRALHLPIESSEKPRQKKERLFTS